MHYPDHPTADVITDPLKPRFKDIDSENGIIGTVLQSAFLNDILFNVMRVVEGTEGIPVKGRADDLCDAIGRMIGGASPSHTLLTKDVAGGAAEIVLTQPETSRVVIDLTGARTDDLIVTLHDGMPAARVVRDSTTGGHAVSVKVAGQDDGDAVSVPSGGWSLLIIDGVTVSVLASTSAVDGGALEQGLHSLPITPSWFEPRTGGAEFVTVDLGASAPQVQAIAFDAATEEAIDGYMALPKSIDETAAGRLRIFFAGSSGAGDIKMQAQLAAIAPGESLAVADAWTDLAPVTLAGTDVSVVSAEAVVPIALGAYADPSLLLVRLRRHASDGTDTLAADALLIGVDLKLSIAAATDA